MLGAITGDTVGSVYEFHNTKDYNFPLFTPDSGFTDTVFTAAADTIRPEVINNARYLRSLCFDRPGQTERSVDEMKVVIASEEREGPDMCHESKLNLAHYYMKLKRYEEAMSTLPDTTSPGGRQLLREIREAKEGRSTQPIFPEL